jgi:hypothetical protein
MSLIGKGTTSIRKKDVQEQRSVALGFKKIRFAHKATLGDTTIPLTSLVTPTEMSTYGFVNPNATEMARAQINLYRNNLKLVSSLKGLLIDQLSYVVSSSSTITFVDFTAEDGEIFTGWMDETPTTSLTVVDGSAVVASGILAAGSTDFNIGTPIPINKNSASQIGAVMVFADRGLQYRKVGNITSGDGDYIEVPVAGGLGSLIRFNASASDRFITVMSNGVIAERPDGSMTAMIERVQGQVDAMVPTLAAVSGLPTTTFQTAPNSVDLKQFGDQLIANDALDVVQSARLTALETANTTRIALEIQGGTLPTGGSPSNNVQGTIIWNANSVVNDTNGAYNSSTGIWTCPATDYYNIGAALTYAGSYANNGASDVYLVVNGTVKRGNRGINSSGSGTMVYNLPGSTIKLNQGDLVRIDTLNQNWTSFSLTNAISGGNYFTISRAAR